MLEAVLGIQDTSAGVSVESLAIDPRRPEQVATITVKQIPVRLSGNKDQWSFKHPNPTGNRASNITIDTHFRGLTPFMSSNDASKHKIEYVTP